MQAVAGYICPTAAFFTRATSKIREEYFISFMYSHTMHPASI